MVPFSQNEVAGLQSQARISHLSSEDLQHKLTQAFGEREDLARRLKLAEDALGEKVLGACGPLVCTMVSAVTECHPREQRMTKQGQHASLSRTRSSNCRGSWQSSRGREVAGCLWVSVPPTSSSPHPPPVLGEPRLVDTGSHIHS